MAATPTFRLTGPGGTVRLEWANAPEKFRRPSQTVPHQIRKCLASDTADGRIDLIKAPYQKGGQKMITSHRLITAEQDALLSDWNRDKAVLTISGFSGFSKCTILNYDANPRNVTYRHGEQFTVDALELLFLEDDA